MALPAWVWLFLMFPCLLRGMLIGNPADPALTTNGIFTAPDTWCTVRVSFLEDYVYRQRCREEFNLSDCVSTKTFAKLATNAGMLTFNFEERIDIYGILGASCLQINQEIYSRMRFSWGFGGKIILFRTQNFFVGTDIKYFEANQKPLFFLCEGLPFNLAADFKLDYHETQFSLGMCYRIPLMAPYIYVTYLISEIEPHPTIALVRWPMNKQLLVDAECKSIISHRRWGMTVGATVINANQITLAIESRMFNQNAIDLNLDIRF